MSYINDLFSRLRRSWIWVVLQFALTLVLIVAGYGWTRIGEKNWWQVALTLLVPLLLAISLLELEAGTMRSLSDDDGKRVKLVWGAMALLVWAALLLALLGVARLVRRPDSVVGRISEFARFGRRPRNAVHLPAPGALVY